MMKMVIIKCFWLMLFFSMACSDDPIEKEVPEQRMFFEVYYTNQAWGAQFKGFLVDDKGQVWQYDSPANWYIPNLKTGLTAQEVQENLTQSTLSDLKLDPTIFQSHTNLIPTLGPANFSKRISAGADRGSLLYYAYQFDAEKGLYESILLAEDGDWEKHRLDVEAQVLIAYLKDIESRLY